jgi:aspartate carbamoyltransferase catalytic subunit
MIKHFLSLASFAPSEILSLINRAQYFFLQNRQPDTTSQLLKNKIFANVFYEPSTRTRCSFEIAAKRLGAEVVNFVPENSSVKKGETVYDTLKTLESLGVDGIVFRHADDHILEQLHARIGLPLLNAGAGKHEHPSQGLLDLLTLRQEFGELQGLRVGVCGDIRHSRVAGSLMVAAEKFGMEIHLAGPPELLPAPRKSFIHHTGLDEMLPKVDAIMLLRIQLERHQGLELNSHSYRDSFGLTMERLEKLQKKAIILHPGPFNRGVEIDDAAVEHPQSRIFRQMSNGVYTRMAILEWAVTEGGK